MTRRLLSMLYMASIFAQKTIGHEALALDSGSGLTNILMSAIATPVLGSEDRLSGLTAVCAKCYPLGIVQPADLECKEQKKKEEDCKKEEKCKCQCQELKKLACPPPGQTGCCENQQKKGKKGKKGKKNGSVSDDRLTDDSRFPPVLNGTTEGGNESESDD